MKDIQNKNLFPIYKLSLMPDLRIRWRIFWWERFSASPNGQPIFSPWRTAVAMSVIILLIFSGTSAYAYQSPEVTYGHALYSLKREVENLRLGLAQSEEAKQAVFADLAKRRLDEADVLLKKSEPKQKENPAQAKIIQTRLEKTIDDAMSNIKRSLPAKPLDHATKKSFEAGNRQATSGPEEERGSEDNETPEDKQEQIASTSSTNETAPSRSPFIRNERASDKIQERTRSSQPVIKGNADDNRTAPTSSIDNQSEKSGTDNNGEDNASAISGQAPKNIDTTNKETQKSIERQEALEKRVLEISKQAEARRQKIEERSRDEAENDEQDKKSDNNKNVNQDTTEDRSESRREDEKD